MEKQFLFFNMSYEQVPLVPGAFYRILFIPVGYVGMHWHKEIELIWVLKGNVRIQNSHMSSITETDDLFWINGSETHGLMEGDQDNLLLVLQFNPAVLHHLTGEPLNGEFSLDPRNPLSLKQSEKIRQLMARVMFLTAKPTPGATWFCTADVFEILGIMNAHAVRRDFRKIESSTPGVDFRIKKVLDYLNRNYTRQISLHELSDHFQLSTFYLSRFIHDNTGFTFQEHLKFLRLNRSVDLMMNSGLRLIDIAMESGFSDLKYMNFAFKQIFGMTPKDLRNKEDWRSLIRSRLGGGNTDWDLYGSYLLPWLSSGS